MKKFRKSITTFIFDALELTITGIIIFILVNIFLGQLLTITGNSMLPTFEDGEQIIAEKVSINFKELKRKEIVIFKHPTIKDRLVIKRIVGLPGESFELVKGAVFINGETLVENYTLQPNDTKEGTEIKEGEKITIPTNSYILLGDNRTDSADSREWGTIKKEDIVGRGLLVYYPLGKIRLISH